MKKLLALVIAVTMALSGGMLAAAEETRVGQAQGFGGLVTVTLTLQGDTIVQCSVQGDRETQGVGSKAIEEMPDRIVQANGVGVDGVSGATITSQAILSALDMALAQEENPTDAAVTMKPGTYVGTAWGFSLLEPTMVEVTVDESSILSIQMTDNNESPQISACVVEKMIPRMLEWQSVAVDSITGATFTSKAVKEAATVALKEALAEGGASEAAIAHFYKIPEKKTDVITLDYDVVVVGMGAAGVGAALSAAEAANEAAGGDASQVRVLAIEKAGRYGGASSMTSEPLGVNPERFQAEYNDGKDYNDVAALKADWLEYTQGDAKEELLDLFFEESGETIDWLKYEHDFEFSQPGGSLDGAYPYLLRYTYRDSYENISFDERKEYLEQYFDGAIQDYLDLGGEYMLETEGCRLIYDGQANRVTGIEARCDDGTQYIINAPSVILATGGFMGNPEMMEKYMSDEYYPLKGAWSTGYSWSINDGKMIESALENGAGTYNIGVAPMTHIGGAAATIVDYPSYPNPEGRFSYSGYYSLNDVPMVLSSANPQVLAVNGKGERFVAETDLVQFGPWLAGPNFYSIWSEAQLKDIQENGFAFSGCVPGVGNSGYPENMPIPEIFEVLDLCIEKGYVWKADTIEELAQMIGVPQENLAKTLDEYNAICENGQDTQYGKDAMYLWAPGNEGPFYCVKGASYAYCTCGALDINEDINVLDAKGNVMQGLYACGLDSMGVILTEKEPYVTFGGCAQGWAWTTGRLAGINAVAYALGN